jgi:hypothetical protein
MKKQTVKTTFTMRSLLDKSILFGFGIIFLISGCSITSTSYEGSMTFPQNIMFDSANFKYVKTISGSSAAIYSIYGYDRSRVSEGLINSAKSEMYEAHNFMPNQIITNISRDVITTNSRSSCSVKVVMTADIYEFSNDGIYLSNKNISTEKSDSIDENTKGYTDIEKTETTPSDIESTTLIKNKVVSKSLYTVGDKMWYTGGFKKVDATILKTEGQYYIIEYLNKKGIKKTRRVDEIWLKKNE